jgi:hypothetical protein
MLYTLIQDGYATKICTIDVGLIVWKDNNNIVRGHH